MGLRKILEIVEFKNETVKLKSFYYGKEEELEVKYGEEFNLKGPNVSDGINYNYIVKINKP